MAEKDSITNGKPRTLEELSEKSGVDLRTIKRFMESGISNNPLELAQKKIKHIRTIGGLMEDSAWASEDFTLGADTMKALGEIIQDLAFEVQEHIGAAEHILAGTTQEAPEGGSHE